MGIGEVELLTPWQNSGSDGVERESVQKEHDRQTEEKAAAIKERQIRLGHIPDSDSESETDEEN
jgi:hypothetical protein